jgi:hypothetical protein
MAGHSLPTGEHGFLVLGWLAKIMITVAIVGIVLFDGIAMARGHLHAQNTAQAAADAAAGQYASTHDYESSLRAAQQAAISGDDEVPIGGFTIVHGIVVVTVDGHVDTLVLGHVPGLGGAANPSATVREAIPAS